MRLTVIAAAGAVVWAGCSGPQPPPFRAVADVKQLMSVER